MRYNLTLSPPKERIPRCADELAVLQVLTGHTGSVLCLQYDDKVIISGSSDSTVRVWDVVSGEMVNTLIHHCEAVLHLRFCNGMMVTCSKVRTLALDIEDCVFSLLLWTFCSQSKRSKSGDIRHLTVCAYFHEEV